MVRQEAEARGQRPAPEITQSPHESSGRVGPPRGHSLIKKSRSLGPI